MSQTGQSAPAQSAPAQSALVPSVPAQPALAPSVPAQPALPARRATIVIAVLIAAASLHLASEFLIPVALALVLVGLLWPVVQRLVQWHIPAPAGATITILGTVGILAVMASALGPTISEFATEIPKSIAAARPKIAAMTAAVGRLTGTQGRSVRPAAKASPKPALPPSDSVRTDSSGARVPSNAARIDTGSSGTARADSAVARGDTAAARPDTTARKPAAKNATRSPAADASSSPLGLPSADPSSITHALGVAGSLLGEFLEVVLLALFILAAGLGWKHKLGDAVNSSSKQKSVTDTVSEMREVVSRYVLVTALINVGQGIVVGLVLKFLDYPSPLLWGVLTFALEFIPYFGGMVVISLLIVVGLAAGRGFPLVFAGPAAYLAVTTLQNNVLSPILYGKHMKLNPAAILLSLMLWYMLWGVAGAFLAVPILAAFNVFASRTPSLKPLHVFLSD